MQEHSLKLMNIVIFLLELSPAMSSTVEIEILGLYGNHEPIISLLERFLKINLCTGGPMSEEIFMLLFLLPYDMLKLNLCRIKSTWTRRYFLSTIQRSWV